jgi:hypothetical protein
MLIDVGSASPRFLIFDRFYAAQRISNLSTKEPKVRPAMIASFELVLQRVPNQVGKHGMGGLLNVMMEIAMTSHERYDFKRRPGRTVIRLQRQFARSNVRLLSSPTRQTKSSFSQQP